MSKQQKTKEEAQPSFFQELGDFMKPYQGQYCASVLISMVSVGCSVAAYAFAGSIASHLFADHPLWNSVLAFALAAVAAKICAVLCLNTSTWISHKAAYGTLKDIRLALLDKLMRLPAGFLEREGSGRMKTLLVDRVESMEKTLAHMLPELTANLLAPLCCGIWMFFIDWRLALTALLWIFLGFSVTFGMMKGYEEKYAGQIRAAKTMNQSVVEYVKGIEVIKNFGRTDACSEKYEQAVYGHASYNVNWQRETQKYSALGMAIAPFSLFPILIAGLIFYGQGTLTGSTLFLMMLLSFGIFGPLMNAMNYFDQLAGMGTNAKEIREVLSQREWKRGTGAETDHADLDLQHVSFAYEQGGEQALKDITLHLPEGATLALVGPSGSGKSTLAKLLAGYFDADSGSVTLGGIPIEQFTQEQRAGLIAYVDQDTFLFDRSILDNIRLGCPEATEEQVRAVAKRAGCDAFIAALPDGYATRAGEAGNNLSGGEKQRIAIVRAMMKDAPILILDEATASTDPENEASIQEALSAAAAGKTLIVVAHRLATVSHADQIAYVENGAIKAVGSHEVLLQSCPEYASMWAKSEVNDR